MAKVNKKIFAFFGVEDSEQHPPSIGVRLRESYDQALAVDGTVGLRVGPERAG